MLPILNSLFLPLSQIKGIGDKRFEAFKRIGCSNIRDLLFHIPYSLITRKINPDLKTVKSGDHIVNNIIINGLKTHPRGVKKPIIIHCSTDTGIIDLIYFNLSKKQL